MKRVLFLMVSLVFLIGIPVVGIAGDVNIQIGVAPPPPPPPVEGESAEEALPEEEFAEPPDVVAVPSGEATVYMVPNTTGLYFYDDYWYRFHGGYWYQSTFYNGPWNYVGVDIVPRVIVDVPPEYVYYLPPRYHRIHYRDFHSHWRSWDRSRHWHRYDWYRRELRHDVRRDRYNRIRAERRSHHGRDHRRPGDMRNNRGDHRRPGDMRNTDGDMRKNEVITADRVICATNEVITADQVICATNEVITADLAICATNEVITAGLAICVTNEVITADRAICATNEVTDRGHKVMAKSHHVRKKIKTLRNTSGEGDRQKRWGDWTYILHPLTLVSYLYEEPWREPWLFFYEYSVRLTLGFLLIQPGLDYVSQITKTTG